MLKRPVTQRNISQIRLCLLMLALSMIGVRQSEHPDKRYFLTSEVNGWKRGYLVDDAVWLEGSELTHPSCEFWMCLYPVGTVSMCDGFWTFTGDVSFMWQDAKVQAIEYETKLGIIRKPNRHSSYPLIQGAKE